MSSTQVILPTNASLPTVSGSIAPEIVAVMETFFDAELRSDKTSRAYKSASADFFRFALPLIGCGALSSITPLHVSAWLDDMKRRGLSIPTIKQRLAGLRMLFQALVRNRIIPSNPVAVVPGPQYIVRRGKTPVLDGEETKRLLGSIDTSTLIGLRDRAMIGAMAYSFARISAVTGLKVADVFRQKKRLWLRLAEKNGLHKDVPCHHILEEYITDWIDAADLPESPAVPLFQTFTWPAPPETDAEEAEGRPQPSEANLQRDAVETEEPIPRRRILSGQPMSQAMTWEMIQRRKADAGIDTRVCNHTFRATGITAYLSNGGTIERAAVIAGHASTRTTQLYDRRPDDVTLDEIEKIRFA